MRVGGGAGEGVFTKVNTHQGMDPVIQKKKKSDQDPSHMLHGKLCFTKLEQETHQIDISVADPDLGSRTRCLFDPWIRHRFFPDPGSRIPDPKPIFLRA